MMKKINLTILCLICVALLAACGKSEKTKISAENSTADNQLSNGAADHLSGNDKLTFLTPEYDDSNNKLTVKNVTDGKETAAYSFDEPQAPIMTGKLCEGFWMLSSQSDSTEDIQNGVGVMVTGDSLEQPLVYWQFDETMKLQKQYELSDSELTESLSNGVLAISPDGKDVIYAGNDCLYRYEFETKKIQEVAPEMAETVFYSAVQYSDSGKYLAFFGSSPNREGTIYGCINLENGDSKSFFAENFIGMTLTVNGDYAAISDTVLPSKIDTGTKTGSVLYLDLTEQQGKQIYVDDIGESGLVSVSADGKYVITCFGGDSPSGVIRIYCVDDGEKTVDQSYNMDVNCKPYAILVDEQSAYGALITENGYAVTTAVAFE